MEGLSCLQIVLKTKESALESNRIGQRSGEYRPRGPGDLLVLSKRTRKFCPPLQGPSPIEIVLRMAMKAFQKPQHFHDSGETAVIIEYGGADKLKMHYFGRFVKLLSMYIALTAKHVWA